MSDYSGISWTDATWNCLAGCTKVSRGCLWCYAVPNARRLGLHPNPKVSAPYRGLTHTHYYGQLDWTGDVRFLPERLDLPLSWRHPRRVFVNSMSDLFHKDVSFPTIAAIFGIMAATPHLTYQVLTKRASRMSRWFQWIAGTASSRWCIDATERVRPDLRPLLPGDAPAWPLPNVHVGISAENQEMLLARWSYLARSPAAVRWISYEPALGWLNLYEAIDQAPCGYYCDPAVGHVDHRIPDWLVVGGESGPSYRPARVEWIEDVVEQCKMLGIEVFVKQDSGRRPGMQGRLSDALWAMKAMPRGPTP